jgi:hypothetical protein
VTAAAISAVAAISPRRSLDERIMRPLQSTSDRPDLIHQNCIEQAAARTGSI